MILTVELEKGDDGEVAICFDREGLEVLLGELTSLKEKKGHIHLMTPDWGGVGLTTSPHGGDDYLLVHSLRLVRLSDSD